MKKFISNNIIWLGLIFTLLSGCQNNNNPVASYAGSPKMSTITVEQGSFRPNMKWIGGKISAIAVNRGSKAAMDTSLIWLVYAAGDIIEYPVKFGQLPPGAKDLTADYGGHKIDSLKEDETYTFWVLKDNSWSQVSNAKGKYLKIDSSLVSGTIKLAKDTLNLSPYSLTQKTQNLDVFVNIEDVSSYGSLATINVQQPLTSPEVIVTWEISQDVTTDTLVSAIGVCEGNAFDENTQLWSVWSEDKVNNLSVYGKSNIISSPVKIGQQFAKTKVFYTFPEKGFTRGNYYTVWIGNNNWDQKGRARYTPNYAYATFLVR